MHCYNHNENSRQRGKDPGQPSPYDSLGLTRFARTLKRRAVPTRPYRACVRRLCTGSPPLQEQGVDELRNSWSMSISVIDMFQAPDPSV